MKTLTYLLVALLVTLNSLIEVRAADKPVYNPILTQAVKNEIASSPVYVGGEASIVKAGDKLAVTFEDANRTTKLFDVGFEPVPDKPEWKRPVLTNTQMPSDKIVPGTERATATSIINDRIYVSSTVKDGLSMNFYSWTDMTSPAPQVWYTKIMWGPGAGYESPGVTLDRGQYGILPGETPESGIGILGFRKETDRVVLTVILDTPSAFKVVESTDLTAWTTIVPTFFIETSKPKLTERMYKGRIVKTGDIVIGNPPPKKNFYALMGR